MLTGFSLITVLDCGNLTDPVGGQVVVNGTTPGSVATYSCSTEFRLNGTSLRTCQTSAQWSESAPTCDRKDGTTIVVSSNVQVGVSITMQLANMIHSTSNRLRFCHSYRVPLDWKSWALYSNNQIWSRGNCLCVCIGGGGDFLP